MTYCFYIDCCANRTLDVKTKIIIIIDTILDLVFLNETNTGHLVIIIPNIINEILLHITFLNNTVL